MKNGSDRNNWHGALVLMGALVSVGGVLWFSSSSAERGRGGEAQNHSETESGTSKGTDSSSTEGSPAQGTEQTQIPRNQEQGQTRVSRSELAQEVYQLTHQVGHLCKRGDRSAFDYLVQLIRAPSMGDKDSERQRVRRAYAIRMIPWAAANCKAGSIWQEASDLLYPYIADERDLLGICRYALAAVFGLFTEMPRGGGVVGIHAWNWVNRETTEGKQPWQQGFPDVLIQADERLSALVTRIAMTENGSVASVAILAATEKPNPRFLHFYRLLLGNPEYMDRAVAALTRLALQSQPELIVEALRSTENEAVADERTRNLARAESLQILRKAPNVSADSASFPLKWFSQDSYWARSDLLHETLANYHRSTKDPRVTESVEAMLAKRADIPSAARLAARIGDKYWLSKLRELLADPNLTKVDREALEQAIASIDSSNQ